jgi:DNA topoisomerase-1
VKWEKINATIPDTIEPGELTMAQAVHLIDERAAKSGKKVTKKKAAPKKKAAAKKKPAAKKKAAPKKKPAAKE